MRRSSRPEVFCQIAVIKVLENSLENIHYGTQIFEICWFIPCKLTKFEFCCSLPLNLQNLHSIAHSLQFFKICILWLIASNFTKCRFYSLCFQKQPLEVFYQNCSVSIFSKEYTEIQLLLNKKRFQNTNECFLTYTLQKTYWRLFLNLTVQFYHNSGYTVI